MRRTRGRGCISLLAAGVLLAACSSSSAKTSSPSPSPKQIAADTALAKRIALQKADLPGGFEEIKRSGNRLSTAEKERLAKCLGIDNALLTTKRPGRVQVNGPEFVQRLTPTRLLQVASTVVLTPSDSGLEKRFSTLTGTHGISCEQAALRYHFAHDERLKQSNVQGIVLHAVPMESVGDQRAAMGGSFTIPEAGEAIHATFNYYFIRRGRAVGEVATVAFNVVWAPVVSSSIINKVASRLDAAS